MTSLSFYYGVSLVDSTSTICLKVKLRFKYFGRNHIEYFNHKHEILIDFPMFYVHFLIATLAFSCCFLPNICVPWAKTNVGVRRWREDSLGTYGRGGAWGRRG